MICGGVVYGKMAMPQLNHDNELKAANGRQDQGLILPTDGDLQGSDGTLCKHRFTP